MRKNIVAGNWKMNLTLTEAAALAIDVVHELKSNPIADVQLVLCPPFPFIKAVADKISGYPNIAVGAQNCAAEASGAFTGEVSAKMIESLVAHYVILGHSERRALFFETDESLVKKLHQALSNNLIPIFCCGETLAEREANRHFEVIKKQLSAELFQLSAQEFSKVVLAYEPVWAIGTGVTASAAQAQEMHQFIRKVINEKFGEAAAQNCSILYGGSCNPTNAKELFSNPDVDGGLIGGASLKANDFIAIASSF
jgi:triosephosphate isomerase